MKNLLTLLSEKFTPVTPTKESCKNINRSRSYKPLFERTFRDMASFVFLLEVFNVGIKNCKIVVLLKYLL